MLCIRGFFNDSLKIISPLPIDSLQAGGVENKVHPIASLQTGDD